MVGTLDLLFLYAVAGLELSILGVGVRIILMANDHRVVLWSTGLLVSAAVGGVAACMLIFADAAKAHKSAAERSLWKEIIWRYPVLIGPAAYYLGEYRPKRGRQASWFVSLMANRQALDCISSVAWYGTLATYGLVIAAVLAAVLQSSSLFLFV